MFQAAARHAPRLLALLLLIFSGAPAFGQWPRFRGVNGAGFADFDLPASWTEQERRWKVELPGVGISSPVVHEGRIFVGSADVERGERYLMCHAVETGAELWRATEPLKQHPKHRNNSFASSTPAVDGDQVYQLWQAPEGSVLLAYSLEGAERWRHELAPYRTGQGGGSSPIVHGGLVIVAHDDEEGGQLVAVDRANGRLAWRLERTERRACFSTPCVRSLDDGGAEVIFTHCFEGVVAVDAERGTIRWRADPFGREPQRAIGSPILHDDLVIATSGASAGKKLLVALRPGADGVQEVYRVERQAPHVPTPLVHDGRLYIWNDQGIVTALHAADGSTIWQERIGGKFFSSPICVGGRLYNIDDRGEVVVLAAGDRYELLARTKLGEPSRATLAAANGRLLIRTDSHLWAFGR